MNTWPYYSPALRKDMDELLAAGGSLSAYRANRLHGSGPKEGSHAWRLEREIEKKFKVKHAVAVNSGTAALHAALEAVGVRGREVVTSPFTFSATASAILLAGGVPRFADVDPYTYCITAETVKPHVSQKTAAILPVHIFGYFPGISALRRFGVPVIEDACQAVGARRGEELSATSGAAGAYSFNGSKNVPCGEGGALVTNSDEIAEKARLLANHAENFDSPQVGYNYRLAEPMALIARHGLRELDERNETRRRLSYTLYRDIGLIPDPVYLDTWDSHVFYVTPFTVKRGRKAFIERMKRKGFTIGGGYITPPLHHYPAFRKYAKRELPVVDELSFKTLCLAYDLTPDKPLSYARRMGKAIRECLS